ncbi:MAG: hypothetical protein ACKO37_01450 [Vampirovibrionales bacterium]
MCYYTDRFGQRRMIPDGFEGSIHDCPHHDREENAHTDSKLSMMKDLPKFGKNIKNSVDYVWQQMQEDQALYGEIDPEKDYTLQHDPSFDWHNAAYRDKPVVKDLVKRLVLRGLFPNQDGKTLSVIPPETMNRFGYTLKTITNPYTGEEESFYTPPPQEPMLIAGKVEPKLNVDGTPVPYTSPVHRLNQPNTSAHANDKAVLESHGRLNASGVKPPSSKITPTRPISPRFDLWGLYMSNRKHDADFQAMETDLHSYTHALVEARGQGKINDLDIAGAVFKHAAKLSGGDANTTLLLVESIGIVKKDPKAPSKSGSYLNGNKMLNVYCASDKNKSNIAISSKGYHPDYHDGTPNQFGHCLSMFSLTLRSGAPGEVARRTALEHEMPGTEAGQSETDLKASIVAMQLAKDVRNGKVPVEQWGDEWRYRFSKPFASQSNNNDKNAVAKFNNSDERKAVIRRNTFIKDSQEEIKKAQEKIKKWFKLP